MLDVTAQSKVAKNTDLQFLINQIADKILTCSLKPADLAHGMRDVFGGTDAAGAWSWRMAYDVMQAAGITAMRAHARPGKSVNAEDIAHRLLTETRRSEAQIRLQQFSTPLPYASLLSKAAALQPGDLVLEPSAGTGALAACAALGGAELMINEIDPFRAQLLGILFDTAVTQHDGEHIDDLLTDFRTPDVVIMNPPFSSSVDRANDKQIAAKHILSAAKRLAPGGRLVAIMPTGFTPERTPGLYKRLMAQMTLRACLNVPGQIYRKLGTSVDTQLMVFDKTICTDRAISGSVANLAAAHKIISTALHPRSVVQRPNVDTARDAPDNREIATRKQARPTRRIEGRQRRAPNALTPLAFKSLETPRTNVPISDIYARYQPQRMEIENAQPHPTPLVESIAMASVAPPMPTDAHNGTLKLPAKLINEGLLSDAQLETVIMANEAHARDLPGRYVINDDQTQMMRKDGDEHAVPYRLGYFLGDGTGCGKGRECAGLILVNWLAGRRKAVWVSKSATLIEDAIRDWSDLGGSPADIRCLSKWKPDEEITLGDGILFVTYATLRSAGKEGTTRLNQLLEWLGDDFDGVIAFDEAHAMQNAAGSETGRGTSKPSQQGLAGLRLQLATPRSRVFYVSATGATTVHNLAYASRLGLWGQGAEYPFPSRESFVSAMEAGGVAAMEVVARDLKTLGLYTARALSFEGVEYDVLEHKLTDAQTEIYDSYADAFRTIHHNLEDALMAVGIVDADGKTNASAAKSAARSRFESTKQRFFSHLLMGMKARLIIDQMKADIADGWACVVQLVSTGESLLKRRLETMDPEDELVAGALTPRDYVIGYLEGAFPIHATKLVEIDGNMVAEPLKDADGNRVVSREALALRNAVMEDLMTRAPIPSALDQIVWAFGEDAIAEVTGRSIRPIENAKGTLTIEKRSASSNSSETAAFMNGDKDILIFSDAGGTGRSYHAAQSAANQKRRRHYLLEPGWRADAAIQGLGRTHRSAQVSAPFFRVCTTDVHGEKRFTSTIARRLDQLGALTKGQRETGSQGMFRPEDNLESPIARRALRGYYADIANDRAEAISYDGFIDWTALRLTDKEGVMLEDLPPIQRFLNRVLALPIHIQNALFSEFMARIADQTERARENGTLDVGVETLRGETIRQTSVEDLWTCPQSKAVTRIVGLEVTDPVYVPTAEDALERSSRLVPMVNVTSGRAAMISKRAFQSYDDDAVAMLRKVYRPSGATYQDEEAFVKSSWEEVTEARFAQVWNEEADQMPKVSTTKLFLLTGLLLPIWKQIPSHNERIYRVTPEGGTAMIGRTVGQEGVAHLQAVFKIGTPQTAEEMITCAKPNAAPVDLGQGLSLSRRRVANEARLEITGADKDMIASLKALGCFTDIINFQLRVFVPFGEGADTTGVLNKIIGRNGGSDGLHDISTDQAA